MPLGKIEPGEFDTAIEVPAAPAPPRAVPPGDDALQLPRGGWLALRKSGGLRFTSREVVVYRDGRVIASGTGIPPATRRLTAEERAALQVALDASGLPRALPASGHQRPDAYAYEIAARLGRRTYRGEVVDGSIPPTLAPLIRQLQRLLPGPDLSAEAPDRYS